jgi:tetratricopeptide (TPR) repeat protein
MELDQEIKLKYRDQFRGAHGEAFQHWFEKIAVALHGEQCFLAIRVTQGDGGLDGLVLKEGRVYQLYAPPSLATDPKTAAKIKADFDKAKRTVRDSLKAWTFVHNSADGKVGRLTAQALTHLKQNHPGVDIEALGIDGLWERLEKLPRNRLAALFGISIPVASAPPPPATIPREIPAPPPDFTGREKDIKELLAEINRAGAVAITGLRGMGGIGKTVLAEKLAEILAPSFPDGQLYMDLKGAGDGAPMPPVEAQAHVIRAFDRAAQIPERPEDVDGLYRSVLGGKKVLILADNASDARHVLPLVPPSGCALIVTSRHNFAIPGLKLRNLEELSAAEARDLLLKIEPRIGEHANEIADLCGRLPLALRASASLLAVTPGLSPKEYSARLKNERARLGEIGTEGVEIGVEASLELSYRSLAHGPAQTLRQMSVFPGGFDADAEAEVCQDPQNRYLAGLERRSLVQFDAKSGRYRLHDLVRVFASGKASAEERAEAEERHAVHYEGVLRNANKSYMQGGESVLRGLGLLDQEWANVRAGHAWACSQSAANNRALGLCNRYPDAAFHLLDLRQHPKERIKWLEVALEASRTLKDRASEGYHLGNLGAAYHSLGDYRRSIEYHEQHLAIAREVGDRLGEGAALGNLGIAYYSLGECRRAIEYHEKALAIDREIGDRLGEGTALGGLGLAYYSLGEYRRAIEYQEHAIAHEIGDRRGEGNALGNLGIAYYSLSEDRRAIEYYEQQLAITREIGDRRGEGNALFNMGLALDNLGERETAITHATEALKIFEAIEAPAAAKVRSQLTNWRAASPPAPDPE